MVEPIPFDEHAERLQIRSAPKPVSRINRKVLLTGAAIGALLLFAAASIALKPPRASDAADRRELYNTRSVRTPEGLASLPASYGEIAPPTNVPRLGPPFAGDLGGTILQAERDLGLEPELAPRTEDDFRPNALDEAERARRMREAALAEEAARAPVFFRLEGESAGSDRQARPSAGPSVDFGAELLALAAARPSNDMGSAADADPNLQSRKLAFAEAERGSDIYNPHLLEDPISPFQVMTGTLIPASLLTGLDSDLPGTVIAQVTEPVFDTVSGRHLLIPQGSRLLGRYQSDVSFGQDRALLVWERLIFPDGASIVISAPGADAQGYAGLSDQTDHHWDRVFAAAGLATILGVGAELGSDSDDAVARAIRRGVGDTVNQAGQRVVDRNLGIQPTIGIRPGWPVRVIVTRDLVLRAQ